MAKFNGPMQLICPFAYWLGWGIYLIVLGQKFNVCKNIISTSKIHITCLLRAKNVNRNRILQIRENLSIYLFLFYIYLLEAFPMIIVDI